jgi:hypothetical protein
MKVPALSRGRARQELTRADMIAAVASEKHGSLRGGFAELPPGDREAVVDYIRTTFVEVQR